MTERQPYTLGQLCKCLRIWYGHGMREFAETVDLLKVYHRIEDDRYTPTRDELDRILAHPDLIPCERDDLLQTWLSTSSKKK